MDPPKSRMKVIHVNIFPDEKVHPPVKRAKRRLRDDILSKGRLTNTIPHKEIVPVSRCNLCRKFVCVSDYESHMSIHHPVITSTTNYGMYPCEVCKKRFSRRIEKELHFRENHQTTPLHFCAACRCAYVQKHDFENHKCSSLLPQISYVCGGCGLKFAALLGFERHVNTAHKPTGKEPPTLQNPFFSRIQQTQINSDPSDDSDVDPVTVDELETSRSPSQDLVVLKRIGSRRIIGKMTEKQLKAEELKKSKIRTTFTPSSKKLNEWPYPSSPLPPLEPFLEDDYDLPTAVRVVRYSRSVQRLNSVQQIAAPDVIEMLQPSGNLSTDAEYTEPLDDDMELILDEVTGDLTTQDGLPVEIDLDPTDLKPFVDEKISQECSEQLLLESVEFTSAVPVIIGSTSLSEEPKAPPSPDPPPPHSGQTRFMSYDSNSYDENDESQHPVVITQADEISDQNSVKSYDRHLVNSRGLVNSHDKHLVDDQDQLIAYDEDQRHSEDQCLELDGVIKEDEEDANYYEENNEVNSEDPLRGVQVFSDEEGRLIIVQPNGVTSVAPAGSQVVQIDTGEIIILQPTEDGNTIAVPLSGETPASFNHSVDSVSGSVAVVNQDGTVSFLMEDPNGNVTSVV